MVRKTKDPDLIRLEADFAHLSKDVTGLKESVLGLAESVNELAQQVASSLTVFSTISKIGKVLVTVIVVGCSLISTVIAIK